jgi:hypothetical protein
MIAQEEDTREDPGAVSALVRVSLRQMRLHVSFQRASGGERSLTRGAPGAPVVVMTTALVAGPI